MRRVKCEGERAETRWKLWLREKPILRGETDAGDADGWEDGGYGTGARLEGHGVFKKNSSVFRFGFSDFIVEV